MARLNKTETDQFQQIGKIYHEMIDANFKSDRVRYNELVAELRKVVKKNCK